MLKIIVTIIQLLCSLVLILTVLLQSGSKQGLGSIAGAADSFVSKAKVKGVDEKLRKITIIFTILFIVTTVALNIFALGAK